MTLAQTDYEKFEQSSVENRRRLREEELILEVTEMLCNTMEANNINQTQVATNLGKSKGFISQLLAGGRNLTLRSIADVADAIGCTAHFALEPQQVYADNNGFSGEQVTIHEMTLSGFFSNYGIVTTPTDITVDDYGKEKLAA